MKKLIVVLIAVVLLCCGCGKIEEKNLTQEQKIDKMIKEMSIDEKIGQMLIIYYNGYEYNSTISSAIETVKPGGIILFPENLKSYEQVTSLVNSMQENSNIPMLISTDQEGGLVQRLKNIEGTNVTVIPAMQELGNTNDENLAFQVGEVIGEELNSFGINTDFAPVMDIYSNPLNTVIGNRSFGTTSDVVSKMGIAVANGLKSANIIPVYKHFPGHGDTAEDSHYTLPVLDKTKAELYQLELKPFIEAIKNEAPMIMVGHIAVPQLTGDNTPASLSSKVINDLLINELDFKGVVVTDALNMGALTNDYSSDEILIKSINAGVNMLLMPGSSKSTVAKIKGALASNKITEEQINNSVKKILTMKFNAGLFEEKQKPSIETVGSEAHQMIIDKIKETSN